MQKNYLLKEYLKKQTKKYNIKIARLHKMPGYSTCNKEQLADKLADYLLSSNRTEDFLSYLSKDEIDLLASKAPSKDSFLCRRLYEAGYCFASTDGTFLFPEDVNNVCTLSDTVHTPDNNIEADSAYDGTPKSWLLDCLEVAGYLYGAFPYKNLQEMYEKAYGQPISIEEIKTFLLILPEYFQHFSMTSNMIVHTSLTHNNLYEKIRLCQGANPYYYPSREEIAHLARYGFMVDSHVEKFMDYMKNTLKMSQEEINRQLSLIQSTFRQGGSMKDALDQLEKITSIDKEDDTYFSLINEVFAHTRLLLCRGYTASEKQQQIIHPKKIYPNSPCPCGSGKKYKKCCARLK